MARKNIWKSWALYCPTVRFVPTHPIETYTQLTWHAVSLQQPICLQEGTTINWISFFIFVCVFLSRLLRHINPAVDVVVPCLSNNTGFNTPERPRCQLIEPDSNQSGEDGLPLLCQTWESQNWWTIFPPDSTLLSLGLNQVEIGNGGLWGRSGLGCRGEWSNCSDKGLMLSPLWCSSGGICWDFTVAFSPHYFCAHQNSQILQLCRNYAKWRPDLTDQNYFLNRWMFKKREKRILVHI